MRMTIVSALSLIVVAGCSAGNDRGYIRTYGHSNGVARAGKMVDRGGHCDVLLGSLLALQEGNPAYALACTGG